MARPKQPSCGQDHYNSQLTEDDVRLIRELVDYRDSLKKELKQLSDRAIAEKFSVTHSAIYRIRHGSSWGHLI